MTYGDIIAGLDIGTTRVCAIIGEFNENDELEILGVGTSPTNGLRKGVVINIEATQKSVLEAIEQAEQMAGREVESVIASVAGPHIEGINSRGVVAVNSKGREITQSDVDRVMEAARAVVLPMDREIIHLLPQEYLVDDQRGVKNPRDMIGVRLEAEVHLLTASVTAAQNLIKCINRAGFKVTELMYEALAAAKSSLTPEERELGTLFINIGGGTTDAILYLEGAPHYTTVLPVGGREVSSDLGIILKIPFEEAEKMKIRDGFCYSPLVEDGDEPVIVPGIGGRPPLSTDRNTICSYIEPRMREILEMIRKRVESEGGFKSWQSLGGVVLSGGGAMLPGTVELAQSVFPAAVRLAEPLGVRGLTREVTRPDRAVAYGLVLKASESVLQGGGPVRETRKKTGFKNWLKNFFD